MVKLVEKYVIRNGKRLVNGYSINLKKTEIEKNELLNDSNEFEIEYTKNLIIIKKV